MCGIVGFLSSSTGEGLKKRRFIDQAIVVDTIRGKDSAGVFSAMVNQDKQWRGGLPGYAKIVGTGPELLQHKYYKEMFQNGIEQYKYVVGHNRAATRGAVNAETAHPYQEGPITLVHNGTLVTSVTLKVSQFEGKYLNDSHTICNNLALADDPIKVLEKLDGAFALVWHDARDDSLNMARNKERPFHLAKSKKSDTIYFASEGEMLYYLDDKIGLDLGTIVSLKVGNYLKFRPGNILKPEVREFEVYEYKPPYKSGYWNHGYQYPTVIGEPAAPKAEISQKPTAVVKTFKPTIKDTKINISPKLVEVPECMQEDLLQYNLLTTEAEAFIPCRADVVKNPGWTTAYTVWGYLEDKETRKRTYDVEIHAVPADVWERNADRVWSIRPVGVKWFSKDTPAIFGRFVSIVDPDGNIRYVKSRYPAVAPATNKAPPAPPRHHPYVYDDDDSGDDVLESFPGPNNTFLSAEGFHQAVAKGCIHCGGIILIQDAEFVEWVNDGRDPMCTKCVDFFATGEQDFPYDSPFEDDEIDDVPQHVKGTLTH